ncbi:MAG: outer membrane beta-barrel protein, partial [Planctomycetota bacterium]|nr:outer membrane beta-barrel protein [Planctomycetota bacterium]
AGYAKYQFLKNWYIANRTEYFADPKGVRTGRRQDLWETTVTLDWLMSDPLHLRLEYRHDESNVNVFSDTKGVGNGGVNQFRPYRSDSQDTIMLQWLYKF